MEICLCPSAALPDGAMQQFDVEGFTVLACRVDGRVHALNGICPHRGAALGSGTLQGSVITCPWHDWEFDCTSGCGVTNPQSELELYSVTERDGQIWVLLPGET